MKLYHLWTCPYCVRVRRKLRQLGIVYESVWVGFHPDRWADVQKMTGKAMVPVLVDGDKVINESTVICEYLERNYGSGSEKENPEQGQPARGEP